MAQVQFLESIKIYTNCRECGYEIDFNPGSQRGNGRVDGCCGTTTKCDMENGKVVVTAYKNSDQATKFDVDFIAVRMLRFADAKGVMQRINAPMPGCIVNFMTRDYDVNEYHCVRIHTNPEGVVTFGEWYTKKAKEEEEQNDEDDE